MSATPVFTQVAYTPGKLQASWACTPPSGFTGYTAMLTTDGGPPEDIPTQTPRLTLNRTLAPNSTYTLQVAMNVNGQPPVLSQVVTLITQPPTLTSISNSGAKVVYRWTAAGGAGIGGYFAGLSSPATNWNNSTDARTLTTTFNQALAGLGACTGWVRACSADGVVLGPPSQVRTLITEPPALASVHNGGAAVAYRWTAAAGSGVEAYLATLSSPATNWNNSTDAHTLTTTFNNALAGLGACTGWVRAGSADGVVLGPPSPVRTLITEPPALISIDNGGAAVAYRWTAAGGEGVEAYLATLSSPATNWNDSTNAQTLTATFGHALAGLGACTGWVRASSADGVVLGPPAPVRSLITEPPGLAVIDNRGAAVIYRWTAAAGGGVEAYVATLSSPATNWDNSTDFQTLTTTFGHALAGLGACTGWVRASSADGVVLGPPTPVRTLITEQPALTAIDNRSSEVVYAWTAAGGSGVEGYLADLSSPFTDWTQTTPVTLLTTTFGQALAGLGTCTGWVRGSSADGVILGPPTPTRTVITEPPTISLISDTGSEAIYTWTAAGGSGIEAYSAGLSTPATNWNNTTDAQTLTTTFSHALAGLGTCMGWVRATSTDGVVLGPATPELTLITEPSVLNELDYDIGQLTVGWSPNSGQQVTAYVATVAQSGQPSQDYPIGVSGSGTATITLTLGASYQVTVRGSAPQLAGPPSNGLQPLTTRPATAALTATTPSGFKVAWTGDPDPRVTGYLAEFLVDGVSQGTLPEPASPANFPGSVATGVIYQGRVRGSAPQLKGPWTDLVNGPYQSSQVPTFDALGRLTGLVWDGRDNVAYQLDAFGDIQTRTWRATP